jgi:predicted Mrr-cat superfamily restriction endonuclease
MDRACDSGEVIVVPVSNSSADESTRNRRGMTMPAWLIRADGGRKLEHFRAQGFVGIRGGSEDAVVDEDLSGTSDQEISAAVAERGLDDSYNRQLRAFVREMSPGDRVVVPGPTREADPVVLVGEIRSDYVYRADADDLRHTRAVEWFGTVPRERLPREVRRGRLSAVNELDPRWVQDLI